MPCSDSSIAHRTHPLTYARVAENKTTVGGWRLQQLLLLARRLAPQPAAIHPTILPALHLVLTLPQHASPPTRPYRILL